MKKRDKKKKRDYSKAKSFLRFVRPYKGTYSLGFCFLILSSVVSTSIPFLLGRILGMDPLTQSDTFSWFDYESIYGVLSIIAIALPIQAFFSFSRVYLFNWVTENTLKDLRKACFEALIYAPNHFHDSNKSGELVSRVASDINLIKDTLTTTVAEFIRQIITICLALGLVIYTSPDLALTMLLVIPLVAIVAVLFGRHIKKLGKVSQDEVAQSNGHLEEILMSIKSVKTFTNEMFEIKKYDEKLDSIKKLSLNAALWKGLFISFILVVLFGAIVFIIWRGIELVKLGELNGGISSEDFFQFIMMTALLGTSIGSIPELMGKIQSTFGSTEEVIDLVQLQNENNISTASKMTSANSSPEAQSKSFISFSNLNFAYPSRKEIEVLKEVSLDITEGSHTAIIGASGSGKSTISSLLLKLYKVENNSLFIEGEDINLIKPSEARRLFSYVPQEVLLFAGTIKENISYGKVSASDEEIEHAAKLAGAEEFINAFPDGYDTIVGERGIQLSGGQRQRIALARAFLKDAKALILDEATSALDAETEQKIQGVIEKLMRGKTSIVIAHRLSTIKNADQIVVMEDGRIVEKGSPSSLEKDPKSLFNKFLSLQER